MTARATRGAPLRVLVALGTTLLLTLLLGLVAPTAQAHAGLVESWPAEGATDRPVRSVTLRFGGPLAPGLAQVAVTGPGGSATAGDPEVTGADVVVPLRTLTRAGTYKVAYRAVAIDGHAEVGTFSVTVTPTSAAAAAGAAPRSAPDPSSSAAAGPGRGQPDRGQPGGGQPGGEQPGGGVADALDQAEVIAANAAGDEPSAAPATDGLDLAVTAGGVVALALLVGLHLLLRGRDAAKGTA